MKTSEFTKNAVAIALGLLISGAIVLGQRGSADSSALAEEPQSADGALVSPTEPADPQPGRTLGPQAAPDGCPETQTRDAQAAPVLLQT
jgi:hypothetical protein